MNRRIAAHAQAKDLAATRSVLETLEAKGWANGHTYAAAVHALCRCGDWRSAEDALKRAEKAGHFKRGAGCASGLITRALAFTLNSGCVFFPHVPNYVQVISTYFTYNFFSVLSSIYNNCDTFVASLLHLPRNINASRLRGMCAGPGQSQGTAATHGEGEDLSLTAQRTNGQYLFAWLFNLGLCE